MNGDSEKGDINVPKVSYLGDGQLMVPFIKAK